MARTVVSFSDLLTFTRASTKWTWNGSGVLVSNTTDAPGHTFAPAAGTAAGYHFESAGTNVAETPTAPHSVMTSVIQGTLASNDAAAPDGTTTMAKFSVNSATAVHYVARLNWSVTTAGTLNTFSVFVKNNGVGKIRLRVYDHSATTNGIYGDFDLAAGTVMGTAAIGTGAVIGAKIETYASGAHRIWLTGTPAAGSANNIQVRIVCLNASGTAENYLGDGTSGFWFWGVNITAGALAQSFISTAGTRAVDIPRFATLTPWFTSSPTKGSALFRATMINSAPAGVKLQLFRFDDGTDNNVIEAYVPAGTSNVEARIRAGGSTVFNQVAGAFTVGSIAKLGITYIANGFAASLNGAAPVVSSSGAVPSGINAGYLACSDAAGANALNNLWRDFEWVPDNMTNSDLQAFSA